ncbi:lysozyme inhibitor LprI family protein [Devosia sp.]|uniref:lysozyme inhibitor LprI family protein n=1 Tax=Devosia sp. TaxID=1871048 RepID=UPI003A8F2B6C
MTHALPRFALCAAMLTPTAFGLSAMPALAQQDRGVNCEGAYKPSEMNICAARAYDAADADLNAQWDLTYPAMADYPGAKRTLLKAQRAWLNYRDAQCDVMAAPYDGGSLHQLVISNCLAQLTRSRTEQLRQLLGDDDGPGPKG